MDATRNAYGKALAQLVEQNEKIIVLDADLTKSTKTCDAKKVKKQQHYNLGIAESNMMAVAAGLAASDKIVYASTFAMFAAGRAYEQIRNSICYPNLNVKICATHAGITVGEDGASHQAIEDIALMRVIPNMQVIVPSDAMQTKVIIEAIANIPGPCYVRLGRGNVEDIYEDKNTAFRFGKGNILTEGRKVAIIACGMMVQEAMKAAKLLEVHGIKPTIIDMPCIKPLDEALLLQVSKKHDLLVTCEEHSVIGGLGSSISEYLSTHHPCKIIRIGMEDCFGESGKPQELLHKYGLDAQKIYEKIKDYVE
ncbi:MAG: transketolase family protein [Erysipelotrichaceae bacterium]|nr:transketolase family protein [Erysipelotrichaceae bacterium]MDY5252903.1 transketolase family protein [Erysipelotrichaceae bacterium]